MICSNLDIYPVKSCFLCFYISNYNFGNFTFTDDSSQLSLRVHRSNRSRCCTYPLTSKSISQARLLQTLKMCFGNYYFDHQLQHFHCSGCYKQFIDDNFIIVLKNIVRLSELESFDSMCRKVLGPLTNVFDIVIYAPPCSGKSTFHQQLPEWMKFFDTDYVSSWNGYPNNLLTNIPELITSGKISIAVMPTEEVFKTRCMIRELPYNNEWYSGALRTSTSAHIFLRSNEFVGNIITVAGSKLIVNHLLAECTEEYTTPSLTVIVMGSFGQTGPVSGVSFLGNFASSLTRVRTLN